MARHLIIAGLALSLAWQAAGEMTRAQQADRQVAASPATVRQAIVRQAIVRQAEVRSEYDPANGQPTYRHPAQAGGWQADDNHPSYVVEILPPVVEPAARVAQWHPQRHARDTPETRPILAPTNPLRGQDAADRLPPPPGYQPNPRPPAPPEATPPPPAPAGTDADRAIEALSPRQPSPGHRLPNHVPSHVPDHQGPTEFLPPANGVLPDFPPPTETLGDFPPLPPHPGADREPPLPPLEEELFRSGGSYLYQPEGDRLGWPDQLHHPILRLPEDWQKPEPITAFADFLGADPVIADGSWHGDDAYVWDTRFVAYGSLESFGFDLWQNDRRQVAVGSQVLLELDLRLTGTERFHVQFRPLGHDQTGGSFYEFRDRDGYVDNSTALPERYWFEGELGSIFGAQLDPFTNLDLNVVAGRYPFALHNGLLINDDLLGAVLSKNTILFGPISNMNVQVFYGMDNGDAFGNHESHIFGTHISADVHHDFYEITLAGVRNNSDSTRNSRYAGFSYTKFAGPHTFAARAMFKWGDQGGFGDGQLMSLEANRVWYHDPNPLGIESSVVYCNLFATTRGWTSMGGGSFNRLHASFEVNPLDRLAEALTPNEDLYGIAGGVHLFRHHEDESFIPEVAFERRDGESVYGAGMRYLRKVSPRRYYQVLGLINFSSDPRFERRGLFLSHFLVL